jgi:hypothetical protein
LRINLSPIKGFNQVSGLKMDQINFIRGLIGPKLCLGAQFGLNWEDWNFQRPNLIFTKSIGWNQGQNCKKIKVLGSIIHSQEPFC